MLQLTGRRSNRARPLVPDSMLHWRNPSEAIQHSAALRLLCIDSHQCGDCPSIDERRTFFLAYDDNLLTVGAGHQNRGALVAHWTNGSKTPLGRPNPHRIHRLHRHYDWCATPWCSPAPRAVTLHRRAGTRRPARAGRRASGAAPVRRPAFHHRTWQISRTTRPGRPSRSRQHAYTPAVAPQTLASRSLDDQPRCGRYAPPPIRRRA